MSDKLKAISKMPGNIIIMILSLVGYFAVQLLLLREFDGVEVSIVFLALFTASYVNISFVKSLPVLLILLCIVPFIYLADNFNYSFGYVIAQDLPIYIFMLLALFYYVRNQDNKLIISLSYLQLPVVLFVIYFIFSAILGLSKGQGINQVSFEYYNIFYYFLMIPVVFLLKKDRYYKIILYAIIGVSIIVAMEYLTMNIFIRPDRRFTTFHAGFFPVAAGILFSYLLRSRKNIIKSLCLTGCLILIVAGTFVTLTRSVWISVVVSLIVVAALHYFKKRNVVFTKKQIFSYLIIAVFLLASIIFVNSDSPVKGKFGVANKTEDRMESIANPASDTSFLMRVEIGYYILQRFIRSPIWGDGLGTTVKYRYFGHNTIYYPDNSWLYILWKGGIIGLFLFVWMYYRFFRQSYRIYSKSEDKFGEIISLGLIGGFAGSLLFSFFSSNLIKYSKTNFLLAICFAFVEYKYNHCNNEKTTGKK